MQSNVQMNYHLKGKNKTKKRNEQKNCWLICVKSKALKVSHSIGKHKIVAKKIKWLKPCKSKNDTWKVAKKHFNLGGLIHICVCDLYGMPIEYKQT